MTAKEKIIMFMKKQQEKIGTEFDYFNEEDAEAIRLWNDKKCENIFRAISANINTYGASGLSEYVCPCCQYYDLCSMCYSTKNKNLTCILLTTQEVNSRAYYPLTNKMYKQILKEIEEAE